MLTKDELPECPVATTVQLIGNKFAEQTILNAAYGYEQLVGGFHAIAETL